MIPEDSVKRLSVTSITSSGRRSLPRRAVVAALVALLAGAANAVTVARADPLLTYPLKIRGHELRVEVANNDETRRTGLMFRRSLAENSGMLFVYEAPGRHAMWMKNTLVPLSVAFMDRDGRILNIEDMEPLTLTAHASAGEAWYSLETNRGWFAQRGIGAGERVQGLKAIPR
ncbi:MAG: DUF192 domain-containing protein [Rhodocyclaceae bacterium]|jgi:uncharacterized membrane protein (UPF0127 family)|nr:DUF192 domain-containing protein [Rhodocyclaceae bacterium]MCA3134491.1 DUF192 domain-containing protein [Rhodocyclaceae bacterium]MCA3143943.1 DUF192 domain-containing protein [Rhodocyclaceae bacterium]MCA3145682.1 DUF192 domain-containing protein [Rhodocyclaceae bacterium]